MEMRISYLILEALLNLFGYFRGRYHFNCNISSLETHT